MPECLANAYFEEPGALIALVRICGDAPRVTGGVTRRLFLEPRNTRNDAGGNSLVIHRFVNFIFWVATLLRQMLRG
jgi:hypothetical protein